MTSGGHGSLRGCPETPPYHLSHFSQSSIIKTQIRIKKYWKKPFRKKRIGSMVFRVDVVQHISFQKCAMLPYKPFLTFSELPTVNTIHASRISFDRKTFVHLLPKRGYLLNHRKQIIGKNPQKPDTDTSRVVCRQKQFRVVCLVPRLRVHSPSVALALQMVTRCEIRGQ